MTQGPPSGGGPSTGSPLFSVLVAAYQAEATLAETLESLRAQTLDAWEVIVVDDGSSDRTLEIAREYAALDSRITVRSVSNGGVAAARNHAAATARADWLLPLDADDLLLASALERQASFMRAHPGYDVYSWAVLVQLLDGMRVPWSALEGHSSVEEFTLEQMVRVNLMTSMTVISRSCFEALGGFEDRPNEDYDLWIRALLSGARQIHNPEALAVYRQSETSRNTDLSTRYTGIAEVIDKVSRSVSVDARTRRIAARQARYLRALDTRRSLEMRLLAGDRQQARRDYLRARPAFTSTLKWLIALPVMLLSPTVFTALVRPTPEERASNV